MYRSIVRDIDRKDKDEAYKKDTEAAFVEHIKLFQNLLEE
jgi:hypothetical protein